MLIKLLCFQWSPPWHSIHPIWHSIWHIFWHSIWHIYLAFHLACLLTFYLAYLLTFCLAYQSGISSDILSGGKSIWHIFWHSVCHLLTCYLACLLIFCLAYLSGKSSDILSGISSDILSVIFWHSIWHVFWYSVWHIYLAFYLADLLTFYLADLLTFYLSYLLTFYLAYLSGKSVCISSDILSGISIWHSIWHIYLAYLSGISSDILSGIFIWHSIWHIYLANLFGISSDILSGISIWHSIWHIFLAYLLTFYLSYLLTLSGIVSGILFGILYGFVSGRWGPVEVRRGPRRAESGRLKSGEAHSAPKLAGWSPARPTALRLSPVEVWRGPQRSRASSWGPARPTAIKCWQKRSSDDHCDQALADEVRRGRGGRGGEGWGWGELVRGAVHLTQKLTTLTWQVGNKCIRLANTVVANKWHSWFVGGKPTAICTIPKSSASLLIETIPTSRSIWSHFWFVLFQPQFKVISATKFLLSIVGWLSFHVWKWWISPKWQFHRSKLLITNQQIQAYDLQTKPCSIANESTLSQSQRSKQPHLGTKHHGLHTQMEMIMEHSMCKTVDFRMVPNMFRQTYRLMARDSQEFTKNLCYIYTHICIQNSNMFIPRLSYFKSINQTYLSHFKSPLSQIIKHPMICSGLTTWRKPEPSLRSRAIKVFVSSRPAPMWGSSQLLYIPRTLKNHDIEIYIWHMYTYIYI